MIDFLTIKYTVLAMWLFLYECVTFDLSTVKSCVMFKTLICIHTVKKRWIWNSFFLSIGDYTYGLKTVLFQLFSWFAMHCIRQLLHYTDFVISCNIVCITWWLLDGKDIYLCINNKRDVHGSMHRNIKLIERTNKMQPCSRIYYSNVS
jgi:hypothetical protein